MTQSLNTSVVPEVVSEKKLGRLKDLLTPILRRYLKTEDRAQKLIEAPAFVEGFDFLVKELVGKLTNTFMVTVDYSRNLADVIKAGNYNYANEKITSKNFPIKGEGKMDLEIILVHFNRNIESDEALKELDTLDLRAARIEELLAFGETHPEVQREFPIIALGSVARVFGDCCVSFLGRWDGGRRLNLHWFKDRWDDHYRFAAVRK